MFSSHNAPLFIKYDVAAVVPKQTLQQDLQLDYIPGKAATGNLFPTAEMLQKEVLCHKGFHSSAAKRDVFGTDSFINNAAANVTRGSSPET